MNRVPLVILALLVLGSVGFGVAQLNEVRKLKQSISAWDQERADWQKRIADLQKRNNELENRRSAVAASTTAVTTSDIEDSRRAENGGPPPARIQGRNEGGARFGAMMNNPEVQKLMALQQKAALDGRYSSLFKQLNLNPAELEQFKSLLVEKQSAVMDVMAAARAEGMTGRENRDEIRQLVQQTQSEVDATIRATLGEAAYSQYQSYEATQPQRAVVSQLEQRLSYSATPLSDAQSQQLVQILAATAPVSGNNNRNGAGAAMVTSPGGGPGVTFGGGTTITTAAITQAQGVLSAQQVSALQALQQEQQANAQLRQQMRTNFQGGAQGGTTATVNSTTAKK